MTAVEVRDPNLPGRFIAKSVTLADVATSRDNNFNLIRMILASLVLVHHGFVLTGNPVVATNFFTRVVHFFGEIGVDGFFAVSGFLVTRSLLSSHDVKAFVAARILRIFPGLWAMLTVTTVTLAALSTLPARAYFLNRETLAYFARNATGFLITFNLPGVFQSQPVGAVNGSLWSLHYELLCYAGVAVVGITGLARKKWPFVLAVVICAALFVAITGEPEYFLGLLRRLGLLFSLGAAAAAFAERLPLRAGYVVILAVIGVALDSTVLSPVAWSIFFTYLLLWFAYVPRGAIRSFNRLPDISYGLYIYAFPVQQLLIATGLALVPWHNMLGAWGITAALATLSWYAIEKPALGLKNRLGRRRNAPPPRT